MANCLRLILNTWHFHYASVLVFKVVCGDFCIALLLPSPFTRRYAPRRNLCLIIKIQLKSWYIVH
ncbi:DUF3265 domain-containing protein [Vibrio alginolyticus]|nr:DUF3265 domain-containing protein [Vibrio alginolyticus]ELB2280537.1 DUF3265 domain-containing protein [Vibrio alginolyticus]